MPSTVRDFDPGVSPGSEVSGAGRVSRSARLLAQAAETTDETLRCRLLNETVLRHSSVARLIAARHRHRGVPLGDLERVAYAGLTKAVHEFDPCLEPDFLAYAVRTIRGEIRKYHREHGWAAPTAVPTKERHLQVASAGDRSGLSRVNRGLGH